MVTVPMVNGAFNLAQKGVLRLGTGFTGILDSAGTLTSTNTGTSFYSFTGNGNFWNGARIMSVDRNGMRLTVPYAYTDFENTTFSNLQPGATAINIQYANSADHFVFTNLIFADTTIGTNISVPNWTSPAGITINGYDGPHSGLAYDYDPNGVLLWAGGGMPVPPAAPTSFAGTVLGASSITWTWTDNAYNETGYKVISSTGGVIATLPAETITWTELNLTPNTLYSRYAEAFNATGVSTSAASSVRTAAAAPGALTLTVLSRTRLRAAWGDNNNPAGTTYQLDYSTSADFTGFAHSTTTAVSLDLSGLTPGKTYYARAKAFSADLVQTSTVTNSATLWALPAITAINPDTADNLTTAITVTGTGSGLLAGDAARLVKSGVARLTTTTINGASFTAAFSVFGLEPGIWNVILRDAEGNESAVSASTQFTVSTAASRGGITINSVPSTGAVTTSGDLVVAVPAGVAELAGGFIYLSTDPVSAPLSVASGTVAGAGVQPGNTFIPNSAIEIVAYNNSQQVTVFSSTTAVTVSIAYSDTNGIVDGTSIQEQNLYLVWLDTVTARWERIPSTVDTANDIVRADVHHFSVFGIAGTSVMPDLSAAKAYPNPWKPGSGGSHDRPKIMFDKLAADSVIRIYNLVGELVKELPTASAGSVEWDGVSASGRKTASGVYFARIKSGSSSKILKFAIER